MLCIDTAPTVKLFRGLYPVQGVSGTTNDLTGCCIKRLLTTHFSSCGSAACPSQLLAVTLSSLCSTCASPPIACLRFSDPASGRVQHFSSRGSAACFSPLWTVSGPALTMSQLRSSPERASQHPAVGLRAYHTEPTTPACPATGNLQHGTRKNSPCRRLTGRSAWRP